MAIAEEIKWIDVSVELPDADSAVLVCYQPSGSYDREVTIAHYDDSLDDESPWWAAFDEVLPGVVFFWAEMPEGPKR